MTAGTTPWKVKPAAARSVARGVSLFCGDALACVRGLHENSADIVFLDPPFNLGKTYGPSGGKADRIPARDYFRNLCQVLEESAYVLKPGGALYLYHLPRWAFRFATVLNRRLTFRHWIAISMKNGFARGDHLYPAHYALLYFTKGKPARFRRPKIPPASCRHCGGHLKDYGGYKRFVARGINLSDVWDDVSPVRHRKSKTRSANELPSIIPQRVVHMSGRSGGLFVDLYAGGGTATLAARDAGMRVVACDNEKQHIALVAKRLLRRSRLLNGDR